MSLRRFVTRSLCIVFLVLFALLNVGRVFAATFDTVAFQSKLVNSDGTNIPNNSYNLRFLLYAAVSGGSPLWSEDHVVTVNAGVVSVQLGSITSFPAAVFDNPDLYVQICFDANATVGDSSDANCGATPHRYEEVFSTRKPITAVPLAFRAKYLTDGAGNSYGPNSFFKQGGNLFGAPAVLGTNDNNTLTFQTNGSAAMTLLGNGSVGIGVLNPGQKLTVGGTLGILEGGTSPTFSTIFQGGDQSADITYTLPTASANGLLKNTSGTLSWDTTTYASSANAFMQNGNSFGVQAVLGTTDSNNLQFITNNVAAMTVLTNGTVGVGTITPTAQFQVQVGGSTSTSGTTTMTATNGATTFTTSASITLNVGDYIVPNLQSTQARVVTVGGTGTSFTVSPAFSAGVTTKTFAISRRVSVEGSRPVFALKNSLLTTQEWQFRVGALNPGSQAFDLYDQTAGKTRLLIDNTGQLMIGTDTNYGGAGNSSRMFVYGGANGANIDVMGDSTQRDQAVIELEGSDYATTPNSVALMYYGPVNPTGTTLGFSNNRLGVLAFNAANTAIIKTDNSTPIVFGTNDTEKMRLTGDGYLGIGTTTPGAMVSAVSASGRYTATNPTGSANPTRMAQAGLPGRYDDCNAYIHEIQVYSYKNTPGGRVYSENYVYGYYDDGAGCDTDNLYYVSWAWSAVAGVDGYRVLKSLSGSGFTTYADVATPTVTDLTSTWLAGSTTTPTVWTIPAGQFTGDLWADGALGILEGGTSPTYRTYFLGGDQSRDITYTLPTSNTSGILRNTNGVLSWDSATYVTTATAFLLNGNSFGAAAVLGTNDSQPLQFETSGSTVMTLTATGNVGVGMTTPAVKFEVSGKTRLTGNVQVNESTTNLSNKALVLALNKTNASGVYASYSSGATGGTARSGITGVEYNGKIYYWGGVGASGALNTMDIYDIATNTWSTGATGGTARNAYSAVLRNGKIYYWGGYTTTYVNTTDIYDIATNAWSVGSTGGTARMYHTATLIGLKMYVWGGYNGGLLNTVDIYDFNGGAWTTGTTGGTARQYHVAFAFKDAIYFHGGNTAGGTVNSIDVYNVVANSWTTASATGGARYGHTAILYNGKLYAISGNNAGYLTSMDIIQTDFLGYSTTSGGTARTFASANMYNGKIYVWGGWNGSIRLNVMDIIDVESKDSLLALQNNGRDELVFKTESILFANSGKFSVMNGNVGIGTTSPTSLFSVGSTSQFQVNTTGAIVAATGITSSGTVNFSGLNASSAIYTDASKNLTTVAPSTGTLGYWSRTGTVLSTATAGDTISTTGNIDAGGNYQLDGVRIIDNNSVTSSLFIGSGAAVSASGANNVYLGTNAGALATTGIDNVFIGAEAGNGATTGAENVYIGSNTGKNSNGNSNVFIGRDISFGTTSAISSSIAFGKNAVPTASNQLLLGSSGTSISQAFIGNGVTSGSPQAVALNATGGTGTNIAGASLTFAGGMGTGSGAGGNIYFSTATAGTSGSSQNSLTQRMVVTSTGNVGIGTMSPGVKLDIDGAVRSNSNVYITNGTVTSSNNDLVAVFNKNMAADVTASWNGSVSTGGNTRATHTAVLFNGKIYIWGGSAGSIMDIYDIASSTWTAPLQSTPATANATGVLYNNKMYYWGGTISATYYNTQYIYDPIANSWASGVAGGTARAGHTAALYNGKIYYWGGMVTGGTYSNTVDIYDIGAGTWSTGTAGGTARANHTSVLYNGKIYYWGGSNGANLNTVDIYDINANSWSTGTSGGTARSSHVTVLLNGKMYSFGGSGGSLLTTVDIYDLSTNAWTTGVAGGGALRETSAVVYNGRVYITGGDNGFVYINTIQSYDPGSRQNIATIQENGVDTLSFITGSSLFTNSGRFSVLGGNVGIGTSAPTALLSVGSTSQFQVSASGTVSTTTNGIFGTTVQVPTVLGSTSANGTLTIEGNNAAAGNTATNANLLFKVGNSASTTAMTILNNGQVGIGTSPAGISSAKVEINGDLAFTGTSTITPIINNIGAGSDISLVGGGGQATGFVPGDVFITGGINDVDNTFGNVYLATTGKVGIGGVSGTPSALLHIKGAATQLLVEGGASNGQQTIFRRPSTSFTNTIDFQTSTTTQFSLGMRDATNDLNIYNSGNTKVMGFLAGTTNVIIPNGTLSVGNSTSGRTLDVTGTWGGNNVTAAGTTATETITVSTAGLVYRLSKNTGTTESSTTTTFNITGLPETNGTYAFLNIDAVKGVTVASQTQTIIVQINGTQVSSTATVAGTAASTVRESYIIVRSAGTWRLAGDVSAALTADLSEWYEYSGLRPVEGQLIAVDDTSGKVKIATATDKAVIGIVSTNPHTTMGEQSNTAIRLGLAGRVPAIVTTEGGDIRTSDAITISSLSGVGKKKPSGGGPIVGRALDSTLLWSAVSCPVVTSIDDIVWPVDDGTNSAHPCFTLPDGRKVGKIMVFLNVSYDDSQLVPVVVAPSIQNANQFVATEYISAASLTEIPLGHIVSFDHTQQVASNGVYSIIYHVQTALDTQSNTVIGVMAGLKIPNEPFDIVSNPYAVASRGATRVWVEEGTGESVIVGDKMVLSNAVPGYAVKSLQGTAIGKALEPIDWQSVTEQVNGKKVAQILVFINVGGSSDTVALDGTSILWNQVNDTTIQSSYRVIGSEFVATVGDFNVFKARTVNINDSLLVDADGNLTTVGKVTAPELTTATISGLSGSGVSIALQNTESFTVTIGGTEAIKASVAGVKVNNLSVSSQQAGRVTIPAGTTSITVATSLATTQSVVVVTPHIPVQVGVTSANGYIVLTLVSSQAQDVDCNWVIMNVQ